MDTKSFYSALVPARALEHLYGALERIQKRARKLGVAAPTMSVEFEYRKVTVGDFGASIQVPMYRVTVDVETPRWGDYVLLGKIEHAGKDDAGNPVNMVFGEGLMQYCTAKNTCDHCGTNRARKSTFVLLNEKTNAHYRVGSACAKDLMDTKTLAWHAEVAEMMAVLSRVDVSLEDGEERELYSNPLHAPLEFFLMVCWQVIQLHGFFPTSRPHWEHGSTKDAVYRILLGTQKEYQGFCERTQVEPDMEEINAAIQWAKGLWGNTTSDYLMNLSAAVQASFNQNTTHTTHGLLASLLPAYRREMERQRTQEVAAAQSEWQGSLKERLRDINVEYLGSSSFDNAYGTTFFHRFVTTSDAPCGAGHRITIKGTKGMWSLKGSNWDDNSDSKAGDKFLLTGTVVKHDNYKGVKSTVVNRAALTEMGR